MTESQLLFEVMQELGKHGAVYRCNSGQVKMANGKYFKGMPKGFSDILFIRKDGKACFVEVKKASGKLAPEQDKFLERMRGLNAIAGAVRAGSGKKRLKDGYFCAFWSLPQQGKNYTKTIVFTALGTRKK